MKKMFGVLLAAVFCTVGAEAGVLISIANQTVSANSTFSVDVFALGTAGTGGANSFNLEFQIVSLAGSNPGVSGQLTYVTPAGAPDFSNTNYLFYGDSDAEALWAGGAGTPSWSVSTLGWADDTYILSDMAGSFQNASLLTSRYVATLNFSAGALAAGEYQIVLGSSDFDVDPTDPFGEVPEVPVMATGSNAGVFTVNGGAAAVPEPGVAWIGGLLLTGVVYWRRRSLPRGA